MAFRANQYIEKRDQHAQVLSLPEVKAVHELRYYCNHPSQVKSREHRATRSEDRSDDLSCYKNLPRALPSATHLLSPAPKRSGSHSPSKAKPQPVISAGSFSRRWKSGTAAWGPGVPRRAGGDRAGGLRGARCRAAAPKILKTHVVGRRGAFQEPGSAAAGAPSRAPAAACREVRAPGY